MKGNHMTQIPILYELGKSRSMRVRWALQEIGLEYQSEMVDLRNGEDRKRLRQLNPVTKVPTLQIDGMNLIESFAILTYLGERHPECGLIPLAGSRERAAYNQWGLFLVSELENAVWTAEKHTWYYPENVRLPAMIDISENEFMRAAPTLETHLRSHNYIAGESFTMVDIMAWHILSWAGNWGWTREFSASQEYVLRTRQRPAFPEELFNK